MPPTAFTSAGFTTLTLFGLKKGHIRWGLAQMGTSPPLLNKIPGLIFYKLMGSGKGKAFSIGPDFRRYGLLCTWESEAHANDFLYHSDLMATYHQHTYETWTLRMYPLQSHGRWDGKTPFETDSPPPYAGGPVAILTRASVNWLALPRFLQFGLRTTKAMDEATGLLCSIGLGELPFIRQATFSVWESVDAMKAYAYRNPFHQEVIKRTRAENWYSEELFARFLPIASEGTWHGIDPLQQVLSHG